MDDIGAGDIHVYQSSGRDDQLVRRGDTALGVVHLPPPLVASNLYLQRLLTFDRQGYHAAPGRYAENQQNNDAQTRQYDAAANDPAAIDLDRRFLAGFPRLACQ